MKRQNIFADTGVIVGKFASVYSISNFMNIPAIMCIYKIQNITNGHSYVGSALRLDRRIRTHYRNLKRGKHHSRALQSAFNKHGEDKFEVLILESVDSINSLISIEQKWIDSENPCYNMTLVAGKNCHLGMKCSQETKDKISNALRGKPLSAAHKESIRKTLTGITQSEDTKQKRSQSCKNSAKFQKALKSKARNDKIRNTRIKHGGYIVSTEQRNKISATLKMGNHLNGNAKKIIQCNLDGKILNSFDNMNAADVACGYWHGRISASLKQNKPIIGNFLWKISTETP